MLYPFIDTRVEKLPRNDTSLVMEYTYSGIKETTILLTGDIGSDIEQELLDADVISDIDILKVAHHGSKSSSLPKFISAAQPELAVIQVAEDNRYGHPHEEVLEMLSAHTQVIRNDYLGTISLRIDNEGYEIQE